MASQRDINSPEYKSLSKKALQPSFQLNFEEYQFNKTGDLKTFLPIHDDTWGELNRKVTTENSILSSTGSRRLFSTSYSLIQIILFVKLSIWVRNPVSRREFDEIDYFYLINAWTSYEDSQEPNFDDVANDCNEFFGYDARKSTKV